MGTGAQVHLHPSFAPFTALEVSTVRMCGFESKTFFAEERRVRLKMRKGNGLMKGSSNVRILHIVSLVGFFARGSRIMRQPFGAGRL